jgi:tetratricopeptide (TPR) repeat protein
MQVSSFCLRCRRMASMESGRGRMRWGRVTGTWLGVFIAICIATPLPVHAAQDPSAELEREFQAAMDAQQKGDLTRSNAILVSLRRRHPGIFAVDESLGMNYAAQQKYAEALPLLQAATGEDPSSDVAFANLGAALFKLHRNQEALTELEHAVRLNPQNSVTQQSLGEVLLAEGKASRAAEAYEAALAIKPDDLDLKLACATALVAAGAPDKARGLLGDVPQLNERADAQQLIAEIDEKKGDYQQAVAHFTRAAEIEPSEERVWALGEEFLRHWTFEAAIREFEFAAERFPTSTRMKLGLGAAYFGGAHYASAIPVFAALLKEDKNNALDAELLGMACTAVNESAQKQCEPLISYAEAHPKDAKANTYAAAMLLTETATDAGNALARKLLTNALAADPKLAEAHYRVGMLDQNQGAWAASVAPLERAIALKPDFAQAHYRLALAYWRVGRKEDGQREMESEKRYAQQEAQDLNRRLRQITTFIVDGQN